MIICAIDSAAAAGSAALLKDGEILCEAYANEGLNHSETLLVRCDECFKKAGLKPSEVDVYAVTSGPGSFTGLRIGMGLVKGLAFPKNAPCVPVPTFDALAEAFRDRDCDLITVLDARQKRVYYAAFRIRGGEIRRLCDDGLVPVAELGRVCEELGMEAPLVCGDMADVAAASVAGAAACDDRYNDVRAGMTAKAAYRLYGEGVFCDAGALTPFYLQLSQAERTRKEKENEK